MVFKTRRDSEESVEEPQTENLTKELELYTVYETVTSIPFKEIFEQRK